MSIVINNDNCTDVLYKGKSSDALYLGRTECWRKKKEAYLTTGTAINAALNKEAVAFSRSANAPAESVTSTDISRDGDNSVITWYDTTDKIQYWYSDADDIYMASSSSELFSNCVNMVNIDMIGWDSSNLTLTISMFNNCEKLESLDDVSNWNTSKFTNINSMFSGCLALRKLNLSKWNTSNIVTMANVFRNTQGLTELNVSSWNTSNVTNMTGIFYQCKAESLDLSSWNISKVTNISRMFDICGAKQIIYGDKFMLSDAMFEKCSLYGSSNSTSYMFNACSANKPTGGNWDVGWWNGNGTYCTYAQLAKGTDINAAIDKANMTTFVKSAAAPAESVTTTDISEVGDDSIVTWYDEPTTTQYWYSKYDKIYTHTTLSGVFGNCTKMVSVDMSGWDLSRTVEMSNIFLSCSVLTSIDGISNWNVSNVVTIESMFSGCLALKKLDLSKWDTSKFTNIANAFRVSGLEELNVSTWNTSNVTDMPGVFYQSKVSVLDLSSWDVSNAINMSLIFYGCVNLTTLDIHTWNTTKATTMSSMFYNCSSLTSLDLSNFGTSKVTNMAGMFYNCSSLTSLDISNFDTLNVTTMSSMFYNCSSLTTLNVSNFNTSKVTSMTSMFSACSSLTSLDLSNFDTSKVTDMSWIFSTCIKLSSVNMSGFNTSNVITIASMFSNCSSLTSLDLSSWDTTKVTNTIALFASCKLLTSVTYGDKFVNTGIDVNNILTTDLNNVTYRMFYNCPTPKPTTWTGGEWTDDGTFIAAPKTYANLATGNNIHTAMWLGEMDDLQSIERSVTPPAEGTTTKDISAEKDGSIVTWRSGTTQYIYTDADMVYMNPDSSFMFSAMRNINNIDLSYWDSSKVTNMDGLFAYSTIRKLDIKHWDTSKVTTMVTMFQCPLESVDISNWDVSNVTRMDTMFQGCKFTSLDLSGWNTSNVTNMRSIFIDCDKLVSLDLSNFDTTNVTNMATMFNNCTALSSLNISSFNTSKVTNMAYMFNNCPVLTNITYGSNFVNTALTNMTDDNSNNGSYYMFNNCPSNKPTWTGGEWTADGTYAQSIL